MYLVTVSTDHKDLNGGWDVLAKTPQDCFSALEEVMGALSELIESDEIVIHPPSVSISIQELVYH